MRMTKQPDSQTWHWQFWIDGRAELAFRGLCTPRLKQSKLMQLRAEQGRVQLGKTKLIP